MVKVVGQIPFSLRNANYRNEINAIEINGFSRIKFPAQSRAGKFWHKKLCQSALQMARLAQPARRNYLRNIPGIAPPILPIILDILPIFFIFVCI